MPTYAYFIYMVGKINKLTVVLVYCNIEMICLIQKKKGRTVFFKCKFKRQNYSERNRVVDEVEVHRISADASRLNHSRKLIRKQRGNFLHRRVSMISTSFSKKR